MKLWLITRPAIWCEDYGMVIVAEDKLHAERKARWSSEDFRTEKNLKIKEIKMNEERCVLVANMGG